MFTGRTRATSLRRDKPKVIGYSNGHGGYLWIHLTTDGSAIDFTDWCEAVDNALREAEHRRFKTRFSRTDVDRGTAA